MQITIFIFGIIAVTMALAMCFMTIIAAVAECVMNQLPESPLSSHVDDLHDLMDEMEERINSQSKTNSKI